MQHIIFELVEIVLKQGGEKPSDARETLNKSNSTRSNTLFHVSEFDTLRFNQRIPRNRLNG